MIEVSPVFLKTWREEYRWPFCKTRIASEEKISWLETIVSENILRRGSWTVKDVFLEIVDWKTSGRQIEAFCRNDAKKIENKVARVLDELRKNPDGVVSCIEVFSLKDKLQGVGIPVASAFLRFLDPIGHRYGIIDKNIANLLNEIGVTDFEFENGSLVNNRKNATEYERFHFWLKRKTDEMKDSTFANVYEMKTRWSPVDIEMALFAYCTHSKQFPQTEKHLQEDSILTSKFDEGISLCLANAERLLKDAKLLHEDARYSSGKILAMLSWEETAKAWFILGHKLEKKHITETEWRKKALQHIYKLDDVQALMAMHSSPIFNDEMWEEVLRNMGYFDDHSTELKNAREKSTYVNYDFENLTWASPESTFVLYFEQEEDCAQTISIAEECIRAVEGEMEEEKETK